MHTRSLTLASLFALVLALALAVLPAAAAVTLISFIAVPGDAQVELRWETATEFNNVGFFIQRSPQENGTYQRVSAFISSTGDGLTGASYTYTDSGLANGTRYYYKLEAVNSDQSTELYGPIQATPAASATPGTASPTVTATSPSGTSFTPTPTGSATVTPTNTAQPAATRTRTPTASPYPTFASYSYPDTPTPLPSPTRTSPATQDIPVITVPVTPPGAPPATYIPFPEVTLVIELNPSPAAATAQPPDAATSGVARLAPLGLIALIWVLLGGWFYYSFRRMS